MALIGFDAITAGAAVGAAIGAGLGASSGPGSTAMQVDLDEAPKLIQGLKDAIEKLQEAYEGSDKLRNITSPGKDPYSGIATAAIKDSAGDQNGGYGWANKEAQKALQKTIENIEKSVANYSETDTAAHDSMTTKE
ncbi:hypothetical protein [Umezawaea tangerina]|uniref:Excreted virulence factor EspC (Type VII ESX diderm) n=1 Tax=Umezawaea tangerina TaxID=84725 RepID=A0A2T0TAK6_9PSEU|nr:hypothetical protein [Umezawaea tangerina]PRY42697.1 hypothetical protein CLV43_104532 [Umezawaea tangerina]